MQATQKTQLRRRKKAALGTVLVVAPDLEAAIARGVMSTRDHQIQWLVLEVHDYRI